VTTDENCINTLLANVKPTLFKTFVRKWTSLANHPIFHHGHCFQTVVMDGCWKIFRQKCTYEYIVYTPPDLPQIWTGCVETPSRGSYYCKNHKDSELTIRVNGTIKNFKPGDIRLSKLSKYYEIFYFN
jgi:hypothetical protein